MISNECFVVDISVNVLSLKGILWGNAPRQTLRRWNSLLQKYMELIIEEFSSAHVQCINLTNLHWHGVVNVLAVQPVFVKPLDTA